ncbi:MAG: HAD-IA family hydrolase [Pseudomonadota bacterium]
MSASLKLVVFDVDGTLVDSQNDIMQAMQTAFAAVGAPMPSRAVILGGVGLSLDVIFSRIAPALSLSEHEQMQAAYRACYADLRARAAVDRSSPLYPGAADALMHLRAMPEVLLGLATGKSRRGLDRLIHAHGLEGVFVTQQVADFHPSKPHPSMLLSAMAEAGVAPKDTVMIGDTSFDMEMATAADVLGIGVSWGYHTAAQLAQATEVLDAFDHLPAALERIWSSQA